MRWSLLCRHTANNERTSDDGHTSDSAQISDGGHTSYAAHTSDDGHTSHAAHRTPRIAHPCPTSDPAPPMMERSSSVGRYSDPAG
ncbi:hypothetical protein [Leucobacter chromiireducens]|uniref:Uncharacterized protein n=1 Tax=Leucobacter chromiireducens subsp. solipictus TaxID=398235 RepID=A0ABS1SJ63_9MICO|nr:hypothetical protein [Leucobacter chromiireducens]MBL3680057.1 hypothetical protein [Leucobacter chromiireducens subsp. solipictus]